MNTRRSFLKIGLFSGVASALSLGARNAVVAEPEPNPPPPKKRKANDPSYFKRSSKSGCLIAERLEELKKRGDRELLYKFLYRMPKGGDIHHHLGGAMLPEMWWDIATDPSRNGGQTFYTRYRLSTFELPASLKGWSGPNTIRWLTIDQKIYDSLSVTLKSDFKPMQELSESEKKQWLSSVVLDSVDEGRNEFFEYHWPRLGSLLSDVVITTELLVENMKRFGAEGVRYIEVMAGPWNKRMPDGTILSSDEYNAYLLDRLNQPDALETGVMVRFQSVVIRFREDAVEDVERHFEFLDANRSLWRGINMAGREDDNRGYPSRFTDVYDNMLRKYPGIGISIHAGEAEKPDSYIFDTLRLGATRIGHGCNLIRDPQTMQLMRAADHLVEINLISNELLKYVPDLDKHPFPIYLRQGIPCCLNTDDRGMWSSNMTDEYFVAVERFNLSWKEINQLSENSLKHSFLNEAEKTDLLNSYQEACAAFESVLKENDWEASLASSGAVTYDYGKSRLKLNL